MAPLAGSLSARYVTAALHGGDEDLPGDAQQSDASRRSTRISRERALQPTLPKRRFLMPSGRDPLRMPGARSRRSFSGLAGSSVRRGERATVPCTHSSRSTRETRPSEDRRRRWRGSSPGAFHSWAMPARRPSSGRMVTCARSAPTNGRCRKRLRMRHDALVAGMAKRGGDGGDEFLELDAVPQRFLRQAPFGAVDGHRPRGRRWRWRSSRSRADQTRARRCASKQIDAGHLSETPDGDIEQGDDPKG